MEPVTAIATVAGLVKQLWDVRKSRKEKEDANEAKRVELEEEQRYIEAVSALRKVLRQADGAAAIRPPDPDDPSWLYFVRRATADGFLDVFQDDVFLPGRGPRPQRSGGGYQFG
ncbi:MAG: hypothetical protein HYZ28_21350 [Myxococcales bacterium]|nr:hypothetical protein [Myxococcales bacterium]